MRYFTEIHLPNYHTHVFKFGKYKGQPLADVIKDDLAYIVWCHNSIPLFKLEGPYLKQVLDSAAKNLKEHTKRADIIIAPIADNRMFYIMSLFANGDITSEVAIHSLSASFMGKQYVIKTSEAMKHLKPIEKYYLCQEEKNDYIDALNKRTQEIETKLKMAKRTYRDGLFIEEILK